MKKEIPILFSGPMVTDILEGRKTQTRRVVKFHKTLDDCLDLEIGSVQSQLTLDRMQSGYKEGVRPVFEVDEDGETAFSVKCPYGQPGDLLWVRESIERRPITNVITGAEEDIWGGAYSADGAHILTKEGFEIVWEYKRNKVPSIHMQKNIARIWLEVVSVRVERLQEISESDAISEGIKDCNNAGSFRAKFADLWESINGIESWDLNTWVWVVEFRKTERPKINL